MPAIITDQRVKDDCFDSRFPVAALPVLKSTAPRHKGIQHPAEMPVMYYPASIKSLGRGLAQSSGLPQAQTINFIERKVRNEIASYTDPRDEVRAVLEDLVSAVEREEMGAAEEEKEEQLPMPPPLQRGRTRERIVQEAKEATEMVTAALGAGGGGTPVPKSPPSAGKVGRRGRDITPRIRRTKAQVEEAKLMEQEDELSKAEQRKQTRLRGAAADEL